MITTQRVRRAGLAAEAALVIGGSGVAVGVTAADSSTPEAAATPAPAPSAPGRSAGPASYAGVVRQVLPSVVLIRTSDGLGSGVVLDKSGNIVTNAHVAGNAKEFQVQVAAGSPQGGGQAQGIGFAIPSNLARDIATQIIESGHVTNSHRAAIGAEVATVLGADGTAGGVGVVAVTSGGAAERAGLRPGDVIRSVGPSPTPDTTALSQALAAARPGDTVTVTVSRGGTDRTVHMTLGELPGS
jgi:S1-C subfamily serine protease